MMSFRFYWLNFLLWKNSLFIKYYDWILGDNWEKELTKEEWGLVEI